MCFGLHYLVHLGLFGLFSARAGHLPNKFPPHQSEDGDYALLTKSFHRTGNNQQPVPPRIYNEHVRAIRAGDRVSTRIRTKIAEIRDAYDRLKENGAANIEDCDTAAYFLLLFLTNLGGAETDQLYEEGTSVLSAKHLSWFNLIMTAYDGYCLERVTTTDDNSRHIGVVAGRDGQLCTGYQIANTLFVTAAHCLKALKQQVEIATFAVPEFRKGRCRLYDEADIALCELRGKSDFRTGFSHYESLPKDVVGREIYLIGYFRLVHVWKSSKQRPPVNDWRRGMRFSKTTPIDSCKIAFVCGGRFLHGCQTDRGTSGAPVVQRNGRSMLGRHRGTTDAAKWPKRCVSREGFSGRGNHGASKST